MTCGWEANTSGFPYMKYKKGVNYIAKYFCPVQGTFMDCSLISALSSIAWVNDAIFPQKAVFSFFDIDTTAKVSVSVNSDLWQDNHVWCCARGCDENWVALTEKAFAKFLLYKQGKLTTAGLQNPEINPDFSLLETGSMWGGNPTYVMRCLTDKSIKLPPDPGYISIAGNAGVYTQIKNTLCHRPTDIGTVKVTVDGKEKTINGSMMKFPAAASTYPSNDDAYKGNGHISVSYSQESIAPNHCYSILGIYEDATGNYVVLRNTWGRDASLSSDHLGAGPWLIKYRMWKIGTLAPSTEYESVFTLPFSDQDGVFALDISTFKNYFATIWYII